MKFRQKENFKILSNAPLKQQNLKNATEGDQFKVNMGEKKLISNIDIEMYLTLLGNI